MNYYPFHIGDYASATRHLSWDEDCAYRRLLDVYYTQETPLPLEERKVYRLVVATTDNQREAVLTILQEFFIKTDAGWINRRADVEIMAMHAKQEQQRQKVNKRWEKHRNSVGSTPTDTTVSKIDTGIAEIDKKGAETRHESAQSTKVDTAVQPTDTTVSKKAHSVIPPTPTPTPKVTNVTPPPVGPPPTAKPSTGSRLAPDWVLPDDWGAWAMQERGWPSATVQQVAERFRDHWLGMAGQRARKVDWLATWRNWVRNERLRHDHATPTRPDNSAPGKIARAIADRNARKPAGSGYAADNVIELGPADYRAGAH